MFRRDRNGTSHPQNLSTLNNIENGLENEVKTDHSRYSLAQTNSPFERNHITHQRSLFSKTIVHLLLTTIATALFAVTTWFAQLMFSTESGVRTRHALKGIFKADVSSTLAILRALQGLMSTCTTFATLKAFELIQWGLVTEQERGLRFLSLLGLSPTTGFLGILGIIFTGGPRIVDRVWAVLRIVLPVGIWLSGVLLFFNTSLITIYDPIFTYNVTAGVGQFNGSYVIPYLQKLHSNVPEYKYEIVPYSIMAIAVNLVLNPLYSAVVSPTDANCKTRNCDSYLLNGGLVMTTPWAPTEYREHTLIKVYDIPACQVEFKRGLRGSDEFSEKEDCMVFGAEGYYIGIKLCVAESRYDSGSLIAGLYVCGNGTYGGECRNTRQTAPNITTTFSVFSRSASILVGRSNNSIAALSDLGSLTPNLSIDIPTYKAALKWILDYNAANIPASSSIAELFWDAQDQLTNEYWSIESHQMLQSILAFPLWQFNPNNFGNTELASRDIIPNLPPEFYTKASIVSEYTRIQVNRNMFIAFIALESVVLAFVWTILAWIWIRKVNLPIISSYPLVDYTYKTTTVSSIDRSPTQRIVEQDVLSSESLLNAGDGEVRTAFKNTRVVLRKKVPF